MNNNTTAATNPAIIDINDKERLKHLTFDDLYEDAEAREEQEIREAALDWLEGHVVLCSDNDKSQAYVKLDEASPAYMKLKHDYLVKFCGLPLSVAERRAKTAAKIAARAAKKAEAEAIKEENNIEK